VFRRGECFWPEEGWGRSPLSFWRKFGMLFIENMTMKQKILAGSMLLLVSVAGFIAWSFQTSVERISINGTEFTVRVAERPFAQKKGLSGYTEESLQEEGMLFLFSESKVREFWMRGMEFDLDILWIADGKIVAIDRDVDAPYSRNDEPERATSSPLKVNAVLELPAGKADELGLVEGMTMVVLE
jgi:uncharacterized membrane protein (UPF0127 family)